MNIHQANQTLYSEIVDREDHFHLCAELTKEHTLSREPEYWKLPGLFPTEVVYDPELDVARHFDQKFFINRADGVEEYTLAQRQIEGNLECVYFAPQSAMFQRIKNWLGLREMFTCLNIQQPGNVVGVHADHFRTLTRILDSKGESITPAAIHRYAIFLEDQEIGHSFMIGHSHVTWSAGEVVEFPWYTLHATANASVVPKRLIFVAGVK